MVQNSLKENFKEDISIEGERIYLRCVNIDDVNDRYLYWMNDPQVIKYLETRHYPQSMEDIRRYIKKMEEDAHQLFLAICLKDSNRHIGNIKLGPINRIHLFAEISLVIGEKDCWGRGYGTEAVKLVSNYAFSKLGMHKLTAGCYENNQGSARAFKKAGFSLEATLKKQYYFNGEYLDRLCFALFHPDVVSCKEEKAIQIPHLEGEKIYLRPFRMEDIDGDYINWVNDYETTRFLDRSSRKTKQDLEDYARNILSDKSYAFFAVVEKETNRHVGNAKIGPIDWVHKRANFGRLLSKAVWSKGYGTEVTKLLIKYAFEDLKLNRLIEHNVIDNVAAIRSNEKAGLDKEGIIGEYVYANGKYCDVVIVGLTKARYEEKKKQGFFE